LALSFAACNLVSSEISKMFSSNAGAVAFTACASDIPNQFATFAATINQCQIRSGLTLNPLFDFNPDECDLYPFRCSRAICSRNRRVWALLLFFSVL
jgi:hypothetical protein